MNADTKKDKLTKSDMAAIFSAIISGIALIFSTYQYTAGLKMQAKIDRPIIAIPQTGISYDSSAAGKQIALAFILENFGSRPAYDLTIKSITLQKDNSSETFKVISDTLLRQSNPMVPGVQFSLNYRPMVFQNNTDYYFKISLSYKDVISGIYYSDNLYYKWMYINFKYSSSNPQQIALEKKEADQIESYLKKINFKYYTN